MAFKLGELLLKEKIITPFQLEEALQYQVLYGGKIGINLIEMGFVKEEDIARMLSRKFNLPLIEPEKLNYISADIIARIPAEMAARHAVVPIALEQKKLRVAMANPTDLEVIDEIAFRTGHVILPVVAPELSLTHALKKYYKVKREVRSARENPAVIDNSVCYAEAVAENGTVPDFQFQPDADEVSKKTAVHLKLVEAATVPPPVAEDDGKFTLEKVSKDLAGAAGRNHVASILICFATRTFNRAALFMIRGDLAMGWVASAEGLTVKDFDATRFSLGDDSILKSLVESKQCFAGRIPFSLINSRILSSFGSTFQDAPLLVPLVVFGRVVAVLYVDGKSTCCNEHVFDLQRITAKAAMALEILILKKKIIDM